MEFKLLTGKAGKRNVAEMADIAGLSHPSPNGGADKYAPTTPVSAAVLQRAGFTGLTAIPVEEWHALAERSIEPNGYYLPAWELAVNASARGRTGASALGVWRDVSLVPGEQAGLIGLLPVVSLWRACKIPLPALASASPYGTLCTPLLDRALPEDAARGLMTEARAAGAHALLLRDVSLNGAAMKAFALALRQEALQPVVLHSHLRACRSEERRVGKECA